MRVAHGVWSKIRIGDLGRVVTGRTPPSAKSGLFGDAFPFITPSDMWQGKYARKTERLLSSDGAALLFKNQVPSNSICVSCIGWQMGEVILTERPSFTNQQINTIIPTEQYEPSFVYYSLRVRKKELLSLGSSAGARTPILNKTRFSNLAIAVPPLKLQQKIASILGGYDDLIEVNQRRISILEEMARTLFDEWFVSLRPRGRKSAVTGGLPSGWRKGVLGDVLALVYGRALKADERIPGSVPVIGSSGVVGWHTKSLVPRATVVLGRKGNVGSVFWSPVPCYPIDTVFYTETTYPLTYVFHLLRSVRFVSGDAAVPGLNREAALKVPVCIPTVQDVQRYEEIAAPMLNCAWTLREINSRLVVSRDLLLPRIVSGELSVGAAEGELEAAA